MLTLTRRARQARPTASAALQEAAASCSSARPVSAPALPGAEAAAEAAQPLSPARSDQSSAATPARAAPRAAPSSVPPRGRPIADPPNGGGIGLRDGIHHAAARQGGAATPVTVKKPLGAAVGPRDDVAAIVHVSATAAGGRGASSGSRQGAHGMVPGEQGRLVDSGLPAGVWQPGMDIWTAWQRLLALGAAAARGREGFAHCELPGSWLWGGCAAGVGIAALAVGLAARRHPLARFLAALAGFLRAYTTMLCRLQ